MNTNEIISYDLSMSPNLDQIARMLNKAFEKFPSVEGLIFHSDQGWQYQHAYFRNVLQEHGIIQSMSRKGNCYDNCIMETFFGRLKNEMYYGYEKDYSSFEEFSQAVEEYIYYYYYNKRIQSKTKWIPPVQYRIASMCSAWFINMCPEFWVHINLTPDQRKKNMQHIRSDNTKIETILRKALWDKGHRYRKNYKDLPGKPDIVLTKYKIAIFCDGEFFHGKDWEVLKPRLEKGNNSEYWLAKISRNRERDDEINKKLLFMGWTVIRFWGKDIKKNVDECVRVVEETIFDMKVGSNENEYIKEEE